MRLSSPKVVVLDLDETLGYFTQFNILWRCMQLCANCALSQTHFNTMLDIYPENLRPGVMDILQYLKQQTQNRHCYGVVMYTNNTGHKTWPYLIKRYFEDKINYPLFKHIVGGLKEEICRSTKSKSINDFNKCAKIPSGTKICYLDNTYHTGMVDKNVTYIQVISHMASLDPSIIVSRFLKSNLCNELFDKSTSLKIAEMCTCSLGPFIVHSDKAVNTNQVLSVLKHFFQLPRVNNALLSTHTVKSQCTLKRNNVGRFKKTAKQVQNTL